MKKIKKKKTDKKFMPDLDQAFLRQTFDYFDKDGSGSISKDEFKQVMQQLKLPSDKKSIDIFFEQNDINHDGEIDFSEFVKYATVRNKKLMEIFDQIDIDGNGTICKDEMRSIMLELKMKVTNREVNRIFLMLDKDNDGNITYEEFRKVFILSPEPTLAGNLEHWSKRAFIDNGEISAAMPEVGKGANVFKLLLAGGIAGSISRTSTAPLDRIKVLMQVTTSKAGNSQFEKWKLVINQIQKEGGGFMPFWKGNGVNVLKVAPETAIKFAFYEKIKEKICRDPKHPQPVERCLSGACSGMLAQFSIYPLETVKTRLMTSSLGTYKGMADCFSKVVQTEGLKGLYRGLGAALIGVAPYAAIDLATYETLKTVLNEWYNRKYCAKGDFSEPSTLLMLACGTVSSTCGATVAYPFALARTRLQRQGMPGVPMKYSNLYNAFTTIVKEEGFRALYRGLGPNMVKVIPAVSISYVSYEKSKKLLNI